MNTGSLYYACATVRTVAPGALAAEGQGEANAVGHFYLIADSEASAGARILDMCREHGIEFIDYLQRAHEESRSSLHSGEEHRIAFASATAHGEALVIAHIFDGERRVIGLNGYFPGK